MKSIRYFKQQGSLSKCEKLVFKTIQLHPYANSTAKNKLLFKKIVETTRSIRDDKYEGQLIKFMDFTEWAVGKFQRM